ncbi:MAG: peptide chain release factor N(5)-glutamine methyltransferase [Micropruina sp.]|nr:peptide chain release factor N(5)-glutamine methyltransferase [Micropruina sp.]
MNRDTASLTRWASIRIPLNEAQILLAHVLAVPRGQLLLRPPITAAQEARFATLVDQRADGTPVQYLTGLAPFRTVHLSVGPGVFIPRPETEVMTGWALERLADVPHTPRVVELCAGSGAISLALAVEHPGAEQYAVELSPVAVEFADRNLAGTGVVVVSADMKDALPELNGTVDLVIANPPYIPWEVYESIPPEVRDHEPDLALFSGEDGLDAIRVVAGVAARLLRPGGWVAVEHAEVQDESAPAVFVGAGGYEQIRDVKDLNDRPRFVTARRGGQLAGWGA